MTVLLTLALCTTCSGQKTHRFIAGTELSSPLRTHEIEMFYGLSVNKNWSVSAGTSIRMPHREDRESDVHKEDLMIEAPSFSSGSEDLLSVRMAVQYWPESVFDGPVISLGIGTRQSRNLECPLDIGYMCRIFKGLRAAVSYDMELTETIREGRIIGKGICISLGYEF